VIDKLLPLLGDLYARNAAAVEALCQIAPPRACGRGDRQIAAASLGDDHDDRNVFVMDTAAQALDRIAAGGLAGVRRAAVEALGEIAPGERAGVVIDKLLPLLGERDLRP
jgi:hypothetical protein